MWGDADVATRGVYQGYGLQGVDQKGRVAIPAPLRNVLEANNPRTDGQEPGRTVVIAMHETEPCLVGYDPLYTAELKDRVAARAAAKTVPGDAQDWNASRINFGMVETLPFDASGRFVLQGFPKAYAQIGDLAMFVAVGDVFEIWNPEILLGWDGADPKLKALARYLLDNRKKANDA